MDQESQQLYLQLCIHAVSLVFNIVVSATFSSGRYDYIEYQTDDVYVIVLHLKAEWI